MRDLIDRAFIDLANLTVREEDEEGQGMVEYGLIIALVAVIAIVGLSFIGPKLNTMFTDISGKL